MKQKIIKKGISPPQKGSPNVAHGVSDHRKSKRNTSRSNIRFKSLEAGYNRNQRDSKDEYINIIEPDSAKR